MIFEVWNTESLYYLFYLPYIDKGHACLSNVAKYPNLLQLVPSRDFVKSAEKI